MNTTEIRNYKDSDLEQCRLLWIELTEYHRQIYSDSSIGGNDPGKFFDEHLANVGSQNIWVVVIDSLVVGLAGLIITGEEGEIEPVVVAQRYQDQGVGKALVNYVIMQAKKREIRLLSVKPVLRNKNAISFFHKIGFNKLGHIQMFMELDFGKEKTCETWLSFLGHDFEY